MARTVHIIGAGLAGLAAAVELSGRGERVVVHEATQVAGGRARSYPDASLGMVIDNGNHLLLSGNRHALAYAKSIGTEAGLVGPKRAQFPFVDISTGQRWQLDLGESRLPLWVFDETRRVPDTGLLDYFALAPLIWAGADKLVGNTIPCDGTHQRLCSRCWPLNVDPPEGSAGLPARSCGRRCWRAGLPSPIARDGLSSVLSSPRSALQDKGATVRLATNCVSS